MSDGQGGLEEPWLRELGACGDRPEDICIGPIEHAAHEHPTLAAELRLARALRAIEPPAEETAAARERVRRRLSAALDEFAPQPQRDAERRGKVLALRVGSGAHVAARAMRRVATAQRPWLVAAILLLVVTGLVRASQTATSALPGSPLYALKRGEEWLALQTPLSDSQRGAMLGVVARRRLAELRIVAARGDAAEARTLTRDLGATVEGIIQLTADMAARHEDTRSATTTLAQTLAAEDSALRAAQQRGQTLLVQSLVSATTHQQQAIEAHHLVVPPATGPANSAHSPKAGGASVGSGSSNAQSHTPPRGVYSGSAKTPSGPDGGADGDTNGGNGNGGGNGDGDGNGDGGGNGNGGNGDTGNGGGNGNGNGNGGGQPNGTPTPSGGSPPGRHEPPSRGGHRVR